VASRLCCACQTYGNSTEPNTQTGGDPVAKRQRRKFRDAHSTVVVITGWGVWLSSEDWPTFYQWRGDRGEGRSLRVAPGHQFQNNEDALLRELVTLIMQNAWDADVLGARDGRADGFRGRISHNEWYEVLAP
jgi:hypothetical protein